MQDFRNLEVWAVAHQLTLNLYRFTKSFPKEELYGLVSQMRRAGISIGSNIAEGCGKYGDADLTRFLQIGMGSASELQYQLLLAHDLGYLGQAEYQHLNSETIRVKKMLSSLIASLRPKTALAASN